VDAGEYVDAFIRISEDSIVGSVVGFVISSVDIVHSLYLFLPVPVVHDRSVVMGSIIYKPWIVFLVRLKEDGKVMEHYPSLNIVVYSPKAIALFDSMETGILGVYRTST